MSPVATSHGVAFETSRSEVDQLDLGVVDVACPNRIHAPFQTPLRSPSLHWLAGWLVHWFIGECQVGWLVGIPIWITINDSIEAAVGPR